MLCQSLCLFSNHKLGMKSGVTHCETHPGSRRKVAGGAGSKKGDVKVKESSPLASWYYSLARLLSDKANGSTGPTNYEGSYQGSFSRLYLKHVEGFIVSEKLLKQRETEWHKAWVCVAGLGSAGVHVVRFAERRVRDTR